MNDIKRIQAAIDKLDKLKADSTPGPWHEWMNDLTDRVEVWHDQEVRRWVADVGDDEPNAHADADLIVTTHRTIDAQLDLLRLAIEYGPLGEGQGSRFSRVALALADAILGDSE